MGKHKKKSIKLTDKSTKATNHKRTKKSMRNDDPDEKDNNKGPKTYINCKSKDFGS